MDDWMTMRPATLALILLTLAASGAAVPSWLEITVVDSLTNLPVSYFGRIESEGYRSCIGPGIWRVPPQDYNAVLHGPLHVPVRCSVSVAAACTSRIQIRLTPVTHADTALSAVCGRVADSISGEPVIRAHVRVKDQDQPDYVREFNRSNTSGDYAVQAAPGKLTVICRAIGYRVCTTEVHVAPNEIARHDFRMATGKPDSDSCLRLLRDVRILALVGSQYTDDGASISHNDSLRLLLWHTYQAGRGKLALRRLTWGIEGGVYLEYLLVENGRATLISNTLGDGWGKSRVSAYPVTALQAVVQRFDSVTREMSETGWHESDTAGSRLWLRTYLAGDKKGLF